MKTRNTVALLVALAALCAGYYFMLRWEEHKRERESAARQAFEFSPDAVTSLSVQHEEAAPTLGVRDDAGQWRITEPRALRAFQPAWDAMAQELSKMARQRVIEHDPSDLELYGLAYPVLRVAFETRDGLSATLAFGAPGPTKANRYMQIDSGDVALVDEASYKEFNRELDRLRYYYLLDLEDDEPITRLEFAWIWQGTEGDQDPALVPEPGTESQKVALIRKPDGGWRMTDPHEGPADEKTADALVGILESARCMDFVDEPESLSDYGLDPPMARLSARVGDEGPMQTVYFGSAAHAGKDPLVYAKHADSDTVFKVAGQLRDYFPQTPSSLRDRRFLTHDAASILRVEYLRDDIRIVLEKDPDAGWQIIEPAGKRTYQQAVSDFISTLSVFEGIGFPNPDKEGLGLDEPRVTVTLQFEDEDTPGVIKLGSEAEDGAGMYVTQDTGIVMTARPAKFLLSCTPFYFEDKRLLPFKKQEVQAVAVTLDGTDYRFERLPDRWRVAQPEGGSWESQSDMDALLEALGEMRAVKRVEPGTESGEIEYGLDNPAGVVTVSVLPEGGAEQEALPAVAIGAISQEDSRERYARVEGDPEVYVIKQAIVDDMRDALRGVSAGN